MNHKVPRRGPKTYEQKNPYSDKQYHGRNKIPPDEDGTGWEIDANGVRTAERVRDETTGCDITTKRISARPPWSWLPPGLWLAPLSAPAAGSDPLEPPWPDLLIACGRQTAAPAAAIGRASKGHTFTVQLLDPRMAPEQFGLVVAPRPARP